MEMLGSDPEFISRIHGNGRVQIPAELRRRWRVKDGDLIVWNPVNHEAKVYPGVVKKRSEECL
jgi:bifunctional DNA-binding transcriptional regulator/antitoxin component of YhaV-PrlF toxin-antitoxin module